VRVFVVDASLVVKWFADKIAGRPLLARHVRRLQEFVE
jgi:hypothetical protein